MPATAVNDLMPPAPQPPTPPLVSISVDTTPSTAVRGLLPQVTRLPSASTSTCVETTPTAVHEFHEITLFGFVCVFRRFLHSVLLLIFFLRNLLLSFNISLQLQ